MDSVAQGDRCFVEEDYEGAISHYSQALKANPNNAGVYAARAHARINLKQFLEAMEDATRAIELDPSNSKAYLRKGVASFHLEEYETAKEAFEAGQALSPDVGAFKTWLRKCEAELDDEATSSGAPPAPAVPSAPAVSAAAAPPPQRSAPGAAPTAPAAAAPAESAPVASSSASSAPLAKAAAVPVQEGKYRHQWYQLNNKVTVDIYAKNMAPSQVSVTFGEQHLCIILKDSAGVEEYRLETDTYGRVVVGSCRYEVLKSKIEVTLLKADNLQWATLEKSNKVAASAYSVATAAAPQYPTSSIKAAKDWDKVESELAEQEKKGELDFGDPLNNFFKKIFSQGDEDQRRAMMKSFQESNGTVLSTNWDEVGKKTVECTPPDGMEVKKWGQE